jgi:hypothetical protein
MQYGETCLMLASKAGHLEVVKYLYGLGGKELLMMRGKVSVWMHVWTCVVVDMHGRRVA